MKTRIQPCQKCGGKIGPDFYIVKVAQVLVDYNTVNRLGGLNQYFQGHTALAKIFSPDTTLETIVDGEDANKWREVVVCQNCFMLNDILVRAFETDTEEKQE